jgi:tetratricopeptide (TPR) repeat protein
LGDIARIMRAKGAVDEALKLQRERLELNRELGDQDGIAAASFDIGQIYLDRAIQKEDVEAYRLAVGALMDGYNVFLRIGRLDAICAVGWALGEALAMGGQRDVARQYLQRSIDGFHKLGRAADAGQVEGLLQQLG